MLFNALANQCDAIPLLCLSPHHFCLAIACQFYARPLHFFELHFLCMTPPICALLCLCLSLRVKTSPNLCLSKLSLASPLPIKTVLYIPSPSYAIFCQAFAWLCSAPANHSYSSPLRIYVNQCCAVARQIDAVLCPCLCFDVLC